MGQGPDAPWHRLRAGRARALPLSVPQPGARLHRVLAHVRLITTLFNLGRVFSIGVFLPSCSTACGWRWRMEDERRKKEGQPSTFNGTPRRHEPATNLPSFIFLLPSHVHSVLFRTAMRDLGHVALPAAGGCGGADLRRAGDLRSGGAHGAPRWMAATEAGSLVTAVLTAILALILVRVAIGPSPISTSCSLRTGRRAVWFGVPAAQPLRLASRCRAQRGGV